MPEGNSSCSVPPDRLDLDRGAERRLDDGEVDLGEEVVALAHEPVVREDVDEDIGVARAAAEAPGVALTGDADALAVVDAGGNLDLDLLLLDRPPGSAAGLALVLDPAAAAGALRALRLADELAEDPP